MRFGFGKQNQGDAPVFSLILKVRAFSLWIEIATKKIQSGLFVCYLIFILKDQMGNIDFNNDA